MFSKKLGGEHLRNTCAVGPSDLQVHLYTHIKTHANIDSILILEKKRNQTKFSNESLGVLLEVNSSINTWEHTKIMLS